MKESDIKTNYHESPTKHTLNLLNAALPYVNPHSKHSMELMVKATELLDSIHHQPTELTTLSLQEKKGDMEGMLNSIKEHCSHQERDFIDMIMNITRAKKFYQIYKNVGINTQDNKGDRTNPYAELFGLEDNISVMDVLSSMLTPEQQSTFETLNMVLNSVSNS